MLPGRRLGEVGVNNIFGFTSFPVVFQTAGAGLFYFPLLSHSPIFALPLLNGFSKSYKYSDKWLMFY